MIEVASITVRVPSTSIGKRFIGHSRASACRWAGSSRLRYSKAVSFSYSATSTFWQ